MSSIARILQDTAADLSALARQYSELTKIRMTENAKLMSGGGFMLMVAGVLGTIAIAEMIVTASIWLVTNRFAELARISATAGILTAIIATLVGFVAYRTLKRLDFNMVPSGVRQEISFGPYRGDLSWETIT